MPSNKLFEAIRNLFLDFEFFIGGKKIILLRKEKL